MSRRRGARRRSTPASNRAVYPRDPPDGSAGTLPAHRVPWAEDCSGMKNTYLIPVRHVVCAATLFVAGGAGALAADGTASADHPAAVSRDRHDSEHGQLARGDRRFVDKVAKLGFEDVTLSRYAAQHAAREDVRQFADQLATEQAKVNSELSLIASNKGFVLPIEEKADLDNWSKKKGKDLDEDYLEKMIDHHEAAIDAMESSAKDAEDSDVAAFARNHLAAMQEHLRKAKDLKKLVD